MGELVQPRQINGVLEGASIVSVDQFDPFDIDMVMREAAGMEEVVSRFGVIDVLTDKVVTNLFYEPSTRTYLSFASAAVRLGARETSERGVTYSSAAKGEILEDTVRTAEKYSNVIVMRHPTVGSAALAASAIEIPLINAGDGAGEHPTQALLDFRTIQKFGSGKPLKDTVVAYVGDNKYGRTSKSVAKLLAMYGAEAWFVSPEDLEMPQSVINKIKEKGGTARTNVRLEQALSEADFVYMMRIQKERFPKQGLIGRLLRRPSHYDRVKDQFVLTDEMMQHASPNVRIMHPLPRVNEIPRSIDADPRAIYFDQVQEGLYVRMALLALVCGRSIVGTQSRS